MASIVSPGQSGGGQDRQLRLFDDEGRVTPEAIPALKELTVLKGSMPAGEVEYGLGRRRVSCSLDGRRGESFHLSVKEHDAEVFSATLSLKVGNFDYKRLASAGYVNMFRMVDMSLSAGRVGVDDDMRRLLERVFVDAGQRIMSTEGSIEGFDGKLIKPIFVASFEEERQGDNRADFLKRVGFNEIFRGRLNRQDPDSGPSVLLVRDFDRA